MMRALSLLVLLSMLLPDGTAGAAGRARSGRRAHSRKVAAHVGPLGAGTYRATELTMMVPADVGAIQQRFATAMAGQQPWLQDYVAKHPVRPGEPLPYHPNFGITEAEYQRLSLGYQQMRPVNGRVFRLQVGEQDDGLRFEAPEPYAYLNELRLTPGGQARYRELSADSHPVEHLEARFGAWSGLAWKVGGADSLEVDLGTLDAGGRIFLHFRRADPHERQIRELLLWIDRE